MCNDKSTTSPISEQGLSERIEFLREQLTRYFHNHPNDPLQVAIKAETDPRLVEDDEQLAALERWYRDLIPAYQRYSNVGKDTPRSRFERNHVRIAQAAQQMRIGQ